MMRETAQLGRRGITAGLTLVLAIGLGGCKTLTVDDFNNPGLDDLETNSSRANVELAAQGLLIGARAGMSGRAGYVSALGILGRESYNFDPSDPRFVTGLLVGPLDGSSNAFGGNHWVARYANIRAANILLDLLDGADALSTAEVEAVRGFAKTIQAHDFLLVINTRDDLGAPIAVGGAPTAAPAPIESKATVLTHVVSLLDEAATHLAAGGSSFPFTLSSGFNGFDTPSTFLQFNRGLKVRAQVYQEDWTGALTSLTGSFLNDDPGQGIDGLRDGVYHAFSSQPGDVTNGLFEPSRLVLVAHPSVMADAVAGDARVTRSVVSVATVSDQTGRGVTTDYAYDIYDRLSAPIAMLRNEELLLLRAEANLRAGNLGPARDDINLVRQISGSLATIDSGTWTGWTTDERYDELLYNRRYSLMYEGHRWVDMRRYGRLTALPLDQDGTGADVGFLRFSRFPFPVRECDAREPAPAAGCTSEVGF